MSYALLKIRKRDSRLVRGFASECDRNWVWSSHESCRARRVDEFRILKHSIWNSYDKVMPLRKSTRRGARPSRGLGGNRGGTAGFTVWAFLNAFFSLFPHFLPPSFPHSISLNPKPFFLHFQVPKDFQTLQESYLWIPLVAAELWG